MVSPETGLDTIAYDDFHLGDYVGDGSTVLKGLDEFGDGVVGANFLSLSCGEESFDVEVGYGGNFFAGAFAFDFGWYCAGLELVI